jgi:hypothetical protein
MMADWERSIAGECTRSKTAASIVILLKGNPWMDDDIAASRKARLIEEERRAGHRNANQTAVTRVEVNGRVCS